MSGVPQDQNSRSAVNRGFRAKDNIMCTYIQERVGFNYFHCKRKIQQDGIHTCPANLVLSPWSEFDRYTFHTDPNNPLCNSFPCALTIENLAFFVCGSFLTYSLVKFHRDDQQALAVQRQTSLGEIIKCGLDSCAKPTWYPKLEPLLEEALREKYQDCLEFKNCLNNNTEMEMVYLDEKKTIFRY